MLITYKIIESLPGVFEVETDRLSNGFEVALAPNGGVRLFGSYRSVRDWVANEANLDVHAGARFGINVATQVVEYLLADTGS